MILWQSFRQNLAVARGFEPMSDVEMASLCKRCALVAGVGHLELYKATMKTMATWAEPSMVSRLARICRSSIQAIRSSAPSRSPPCNDAAGAARRADAHLNRLLSAPCRHSPARSRMAERKVPSEDYSGRTPMRLHHAFIRASADPAASCGVGMVC
jgi:hypothetical protein